MQGQKSVSKAHNLLLYSSWPLLVATLAVLAEVALRSSQGRTGQPNAPALALFTTARLWVLLTAAFLRYIACKKSSESGEARQVGRGTQPLLSTQSKTAATAVLRKRPEAAIHVESIGTGGIPRLSGGFVSSWVGAWSTCVSRYAVNIVLLSLIHI